MNMKALITVHFPDSESIKVPIGTLLIDVLSDEDKNIEGDNYVIAAILNGKAVELFTPLYENSFIKPIRVLDRIGYSIYARSITFLTIVAANEVFENVDIRIEHSINNEIYGTLDINRQLTEEDIQLLKEKMIEIVEEDRNIEKVKVSKKVAQSIFNSYQMPDKTSLIKYAESEFVSLYKCSNIYDYLYGPMVSSMGYLKAFDINYFDNGFLLMLPEKRQISAISSFRNIPKLRAVFDESKQWAGILNLKNVGQINDRIHEGGMALRDMFLVAEGLHEKKISKIADSILDNIDSTKLILIAGPSSSGKTTFAERLSIQLKVLGLNPKSISADDYFVNREFTPKKPDGEFDFEALEAVDVNLLNKHLTKLLEGKEVELAKFNFLSGSREAKGEKYKMDSNSVLIVEGIHGLNEAMTPSIPKEHKYKIYVSALTHVNIDNHTSVFVSDIRTLRRMIRDNTQRGMTPEATLLSWRLVRDGEEKNIFPYQEEANIMFNSSLLYEINVLKKYAEPLLKEITDNSPVYVDAHRILNFLKFFQSADEKYIPPNSIVREFIGCSCFE